MDQLIPGWSVSFEQVGGWLCTRLHPAGSPDAAGMIDPLWRQVDARCQGAAKQVVLEMNEVTFLSSSLMGELVRLHKRLAVAGGALHLAALRPECAEALHITRLDSVLPVFPGRDEAVHSFAR
ncbi:STAS domain protein [Pirellulimonas nuda]|uniref:STAS domain protein n=1 Tax=Pirellulimonas nuda TaxID=2528009 RepID=A0A518D5K1_9BACT|nr:STAS domain-containing protein [Pirellulimonas nuda]QDU86744.1 STAS domain protein [Pirellulimonas nuda]